jgi:hypothetical protein
MLDTRQYDRDVSLSIVTAFYNILTLSKITTLYVNRKGKQPCLEGVSVANRSNDRGRSYGQPKGPYFDGSKARRLSVSRLLYFLQ